MHSILFFSSATDPAHTLLVSLHGSTSGQAIHNGIQTVGLGLP